MFFAHHVFARIFGSDKFEGAELTYPKIEAIQYATLQESHN